MRATALLSSALLALSQVSSVLAACSDPLVRKEWRMLSKSDKLEYLSAVQCLQTIDAQQGHLYEGAKSRFDDFQAVHINYTDYVHFVGHFQAWHRVLVWKYETDLRELCGYTGAQPYWDWTLDAFWADAFPKSPVFDPVYGFGGNGPYINSTDDDSVRLHIPGKTGGGCVEDGPFVNMSVNMAGDSTAYNPHCLTRDIAPEFAADNLNLRMVMWTLSAQHFAEFDIRVQGGITVEEMTYHGGGHLGVGGDLGEIGNVYSSPGDPLFYMHHANIDRLWWLWQHLDWNNRKSDIAGPDTQFAYPFDFFGDVPYSNVTLDYEMTFGELFGSRDNSHFPISETMDTEDGLFCYTYWPF